MTCFVFYAAVENCGGVGLHYFTEFDVMKKRNLLKRRVEHIIIRIKFKYL